MFAVALCCQGLLRRMKVRKCCQGLLRRMKVRPLSFAQFDDQGKVASQPAGAHARSTTHAERDDDQMELQMSEVGKESDNGVHSSEASAATNTVSAEATPPESPPIQSQGRPGQHYRADIDGLRAVAVVSVILYHFDHAWLPGGFAGVDVFFVISGYVVTASLLRERCVPGFERRERS